MSENVNIKHIEDSVSNVGTKQICIETGNDSQTGHRMWAGKDSAGDTYKFLGKGKPAYIQNLNIAEFTTAGLLRTDAIGDIFGDVNTLGELNTALGGTTIDESTDARPPDPHATDHTDGTDDIQDATASQKGIMTAAQAAQLIQNTSDISTAQSDISTNANDITTNAGAISVNGSDIATNTTDISTNAGDIADTSFFVKQSAATAPDKKYLKVSNTENLILQNEDISVSPWALTRVAINNATGIPSPVDGVDYMGIIVSSVSGTHYCQQSITCDGNPVVFKFFARANGVNWIRFRNITSSASAWIDVGSNSTSTVTAGSFASITDVGNGNVEIKIESLTVTGSNNFQFYFFTSQSGLSYAGDDATDYMYVQGMQVYSGLMTDEEPGYIATTTAQASSTTITEWDNVDSIYNANEEQLTEYTTPVDGDVKMWDTASNQWIAKKPNNDQQVVFRGLSYTCIGDSNTAGAASQMQYGVKLAELSGCTIKNYGVSGETSTQILARINDATLASDKYVFINAGTNDGGAAIAVATTKSNYIAMRDAVLNLGKIPIFIGILPGSSGTYKTDRDELNRFLEYELGTLFARSSFFDDGTGALMASWDSGDTVHLSATGQDVWGELIYNQTLLSFNVTPLRTTAKDPVDTNLVSIDPSTWSVQSNLEAWETGVEAPDGTLTAFGMVADTSLAYHYVGTVSAGYDTDDKRRTLITWVKAGESEWIWLKNNTSGAVMMFNISTGAQYGDSTDQDYFGIVPALDDGWAQVWISKDVATDADSISVYACRSPIASAAFNGDGTNAEIYLWKPSNGVSPNFGHTVTASVERYPAANWELGYVLKGDGTWDLAVNIDGDFMDESPSNVAVMHAAGIYKIVSDNTWGPLVAGTQFYAPSGNFLELFEDTSIASGTHALTPSATPPTDNLASPMHSTGTVYHANYAVMVPSYTSATTFAGLKNDGTAMQLVFSTDGYTTALGYRIEVEYEWRAIAPPA